MKHGCLPERPRDGRSALRAARRSAPATLLGLLVLLAACVENTAPGNDREARLDPPHPPAELASAGAALEGIASSLMVPQTLTDADVSRVPDVGARCIFRFTRVGLPAAVYGSAAAVKLNDKLVLLPLAAAGRYAAEGVDLTLRPLEDSVSDRPFAAELVLRVAGEPDELGYHGTSECTGPR